MSKLRQVVDIKNAIEKGRSAHANTNRDLGSISGHPVSPSNAFLGFGRGLGDEF